MIRNVLTHFLEAAEDLEDPTPCLFETDVTAIRNFVRELVTQSMVPSMEQLCAQWNELASRRKGLSGRLLSAGKRWGLGFSRNSSTPSAVIGSSNYDSLQGFYRPHAPEAVMRKLADYAFMLRDFKLAQNTYDVLRQDFDQDNAWKYNAGANEMYLVSTMLNTGYPINKRLDSIERWLETAVHSYSNRCNVPFYAIRALVLAFEAVKARGCLTIDRTVGWGEKAIKANILGPVGNALLMERLAGSYAQKNGNGALMYGSRRRKRGFWNLMAADSWAALNKTVQAERCLHEAKASYGISESQSQLLITLGWMRPFVQSLQESIVGARLESMGLDSPGSQILAEDFQPVEEVAEDLTSKPHRRSIVADGTGLLPAGDMAPAPLSPVRTREDTLTSEGFE